jgi:hypothetical protein
MSSDWHKKKPVTSQKKPTIGYIFFSVCNNYSYALDFSKQLNTDFLKMEMYSFLIMVGFELSFRVLLAIIVMFFTSLRSEQFECLQLYKIIIKIYISPNVFIQKRSFHAHQQQN